MAGVLQTGTFVNGQWRNETVDINTVLQRNESNRPSSLPKPGRPQGYGLLTKTVIESPVIRWILPVNIRGSSSERDVAFISDTAVQIRYLSERGQFQDVAKKADFGSRIRNARVVGSVELGAESLDYPQQQVEDMPMKDVWAPKSIEYIVLALERGDIIFLFAKTIGTETELVTAHHTVSRLMLSQQPGKHMVVDPSSQYMAIAGAENVFAVYALRSIQPLNLTRNIGPVESERYLHVDGVIHKMEFLFPSANDPNHIILLLLVVNRGITRIFVYEWIAGQDLKKIRSTFKKGTAVEHNHHMSLLMIPLRIRSSLLLVSEKTMALCSNILEGTPTFTQMDIKSVETAPRYLGGILDTPLWTTWSRPLRTRHYSKTHDDIYLAREDGAVLFIENTTDGFVEAQMEIHIACNIDTAFACLDKSDEYDKHGDRLLVGGDSCNGGLYLVAARQSPALLSQISNWSPTIDFAIVDDHGDHNQDVVTNSILSSLGVPDVAKPGRIFALTGRVKTSDRALSEIRYGYEAHVQLESELDFPITEAWYLPSDWIYSILRREAQAPSLILMVVGNQSLLLCLEANDASINEIQQNETWLDLSSRTLTAVACRGVIIQVTERSISISTASPSGVSSMPGYRKDYSAALSIVTAYIYDNELVVTVHRDGSGELHLSVIYVVRELDKHSKLVSTIACIEYCKTIRTCSNIVSVYKRRNGISYDIIWSPKVRGLSETDTAIGTGIIDIFNIDTVEIDEGSLRLNSNHGNWSPKPADIRHSLEVFKICTSVVSLRQSGSSVLFLAGHRDGLLVMIHCRLDKEGELRISKRPSQYTIGATPVIVKPVSMFPNVALICCDEKAWRVSFDELFYSDPLLNRIWFTDTDNPHNLQPPINQVCTSPERLILVSGQKIMIASLDGNPRPVPWPLPLPGRPFRMQYDKTLKVLVVAVDSGDGPRLVFLDPQTGREINCMRTGIKTDGQTHLVLSMSVIDDIDAPGRILVILGLKEKNNARGSVVIYNVMWDPEVNSSIHDKISCVEYYTQYAGREVYSVVALRKIILCCTGTEIHRLIIPSVVGENKLLGKKIYQLPSPGISMSISGRWLNVHTAKHSLVTLELNEEFDLVDNELEPTPRFADQFDRDGLDQIVLTDDRKHIQQAVLISDKACSVVGLLCGDPSEPLVQDHHTLFEAELGSSIIKFRKANMRPTWDVTWKQDKTNFSSVLADTEVLGMSIDGSFTYFTILNEANYELLSFLQNQARKFDAAEHTADAIDVYKPLYWSNKSDPRMKHIEGESLRRFLKKDELERLLADATTRKPPRKENEEGDEILEKVSEVEKEFCRRMKLASGTDGMEASVVGCLRLLEALLRPVF